MTLRQALTTSFLMHGLIFGCALAIARGGVECHLPSRPIAVSLVSSSRDGDCAQAPNKIANASRIPAVVSSERREFPPAEAFDATNAETRAVRYDQPTADREGSGTDERAKPPVAFGADEARSVSGAAGQWTLIEAAIERNKSYPRLARERGVQGVVRLRFRLFPSGAVDKIEIVESSGSELLDNASVRSVYRAAPLPYVDGWVEVPIAYVLTSR